MSKRLGAEFLGTFWLVLGGCGSAVLAAAFPDVGIGLLGVSLAFGLTVLTMAFAIGHISGCHLNPAVSVGLWSRRPVPASELLPYVVAQVVGGVVGAGVLYLIASGGRASTPAAASRRTATATHSPGGYSLVAAFVAEVVMTFMFLMVILGATDRRAPAGFAPIAIGLGADADPPDQHPGDQHLGEPGAQHRAGAVRRRAGRSASSGCSGSRRSSARRWRVWCIAGWANRIARPDTSRRLRRHASGD